MKVIRLLCIVIVGFLATVAWASLAATDGVTLSVVPDKVSLEPGAGVQHVLVIAQPTDGWLIKDLQLQILPPPGIKADAQQPLHASGNFAWTVDITADEGSAKEASVLFRVDYAVQPAKAEAAASAARSGTVGATAKVGYAPLPIGQAVKITVHHGFDSLRPNEQGRMFLSVENTGIEPVTLKSVQLLADQQTDAQKIDIAAQSLPMTVAGRDVASVPLVVTPGESVVPGTANLLLSLQFTRGAGPPVEETVAVTDQVTLGIPGLSDLKTVLQIPSLLFMPGVLVVLTWAMLWKFRHPTGRAEDKSQDFPLAAPKPEFWVVAITLSMAIAGAYPLIFGGSFDLLESVSVKDIAILWFGSIFVVAPASYATGSGVYRFIHWLRARRAAKHDRETNPQPGDTPIVIFAKLARAGLQLKLPAYTVKSGATEVRVFALGFGAPPAGQELIISRAWIKVTKPNLKFEQELDAAIANALPGALLDLLAGHGKQYEIGWEQAGIYRAVASIERAQLNEPQGMQLIVHRDSTVESAKRVSPVSLPPERTRLSGNS